MQIALARRPEHIEVYAFTVKDEDGFFRVVEKSRDILSDLRGPMDFIKFINAAQLDATMGTRKLGAGLGSEFAWLGFGVIHTKRSMAGPMRRAVRKALGSEVRRLIFMNERRLHALRRVRACLPGKLGAVLDRPIGRFQETLNMITGVPQGLGLRAAYQHVPFDSVREPLDPARDGVGLLWYAPVIPLKLEMVRAMTQMIQRTLTRYGFAPTISMTTLSEKCAIGAIPVVYRRPEEADKAYECFRELWLLGNKLGCSPYRINIAAMPELTGSRESVYWRVVETLKSALDPNGILSPGRYGRAKTSEDAAIARSA
jgi:4-cresol dehydrogenase (hydroxylating) flavoprotein subunit